MSWQKDTNTVARSVADFFDMMCFMFALLDFSLARLDFTEPHVKVVVTLESVKVLIEARDSVSAFYLQVRALL